MKVNDKVLSIPPYLSTSWRNVMSLHVSDSKLIVMLRDGHTVSIPGLVPLDIEKIFKAHEAYLEHETAPNPTSKSLGGLFSGLGLADGSIQVGFTGLDQLGGMFQHNPALANSPPLPQEILHKVITVAKMMASDDNLVLPKPETNCQCFHCQVARAIHEAIYPQEETSIEIIHDVVDEDLQFSQWEIKSAGENLYTVLNKLDLTEQYTVFLGDPVGCTCGKAGCEHVLAVLRS